MNFSVQNIFGLGTIKQKYAFFGLYVGWMSLKLVISRTFFLYDTAYLDKLRPVAYAYNLLGMVIKLPRQNLRVVDLGLTLEWQTSGVILSGDVSEPSSFVRFNIPLLLRSQGKIYPWFQIVSFNQRIFPARKINTGK